MAIFWPDSNSIAADGIIGRFQEEEEEEENVIDRAGLSRRFEKGSVPSTREETRSMVRFRG